MSEDDLKPCIVCGGEAKKIFIGNEHTNTRSLEIECTKCRVKMVNYAMIHSHEWLDKMSTEKWNERT